MSIEARDLWPALGWLTSRVFHRDVLTVNPNHISFLDDSTTTVFSVFQGHSGRRILVQFQDTLIHLSYQQPPSPNDVTVMQSRFLRSQTLPIPSASASSSRNNRLCGARNVSDSRPTANRPDPSTTRARNPSTWTFNIPR